MALPHDEEIQAELLRLLADAPHGRMHCQDIYEDLARRFPCLTKDEKTSSSRDIPGRGDHPAIFTERKAGGSIPSLSAMSVRRGRFRLVTPGEIQRLRRARLK